MKLKLLSFIGSLLFIGSASAANITIYYSPTCPHCHHALEFISGELVYEYQKINVESVNVMDEKNLPEFQAALKKCNFDNGGVPVIVIGEKCIQGYAPFMAQDLRNAVAVDMSAGDKSAAEANVQAFQKNPEEFKKSNANRANVITERGAVSQKKTDSTSVNYLWIVLGILVMGIGIVLAKKQGKK